MTSPAAEPTPEHDGTEQVSRIVLTFTGPGMADHQLQIENASPGQIMAAAWWLNQYASALLRPDPQAVAGGPGIVSYRRART
ncbi:MAG: hypothetical protein E6G44_09700 [Actinobacteria bacterium]|nr:MAG: hypothetical protein E6G44_09700 [Actinomycetota bacterium]